MLPPTIKEFKLLGTIERRALYKDLFNYILKKYHENKTLSLIGKEILDSRLKEINDYLEIRILELSQAIPSQVERNVQTLESKKNFKQILLQNPGITKTILINKVLEIPQKNFGRKKTLKIFEILEQDGLIKVSRWNPQNKMYCNWVEEEKV